MKKFTDILYLVRRGVDPDVNEELRKYRLELGEMRNLKLFGEPVDFRVLRKNYDNKVFSLASPGHKKCTLIFRGLGDDIRLLKKLQV